MYQASRTRAERLAAAVMLAAAAAAAVCVSAARGVTERDLCRALEQRGIAVDAAAVSDAMGGLGMPGGKFEISLQRLADDNARSWGIDDIEFLISANPGQPPMPLSKVASGGELSRMSLAIQVIAADGSKIPTMVFDEVDSGVGGRVAEMLPKQVAILRELGRRTEWAVITCEHRAFFDLTKRLGVECPWPRVHQSYSVP